MAVRFIAVSDSGAARIDIHVDGCSHGVSQNRGLFRKQAWAIEAPTAAAAREQVRAENRVDNGDPDWYPVKIAPCCRAAGGQSGKLAKDGLLGNLGGVAALYVLYRIWRERRDAKSEERMRRAEELYKRLWKGLR